MIAHNQIRNLLSRPSLQPAWTRLLRLCHAGMNYGGGQSIRASGEMGALKYAMRYFSPAAPIVVFDVGASDGLTFARAKDHLPHILAAYLLPEHRP